MIRELDPYDYQQRIFSLQQQRTEFLSNYKYNGHGRKSYTVTMKRLGERRARRGWARGLRDHVIRERAEWYIENKLPF